MSWTLRGLGALIVAIACFACVSRAWGQSLEEELRQTPPRTLATQAQREGDAARGAIVFFQPHLACHKCHTVGDAKPNGLGPDLATIGKEVTDEALIESVLQPSAVIRKGFEAAAVLTTDGRTLTGILQEKTAEKTVLREVTRPGELTTILAKDIEEFQHSKTSLMPAGQVNQLASRQQFLDLIRYLMELRTGGALRAKELQPPAALIAFKLPEYEQHIDHAGFIRDWNDAALKRGEKIYQRVCQNCHGTKDQPGSLPTSLRFASGKFKNGSDPLAMYRTLTHGFGLMTPQTWMVPSQKYDVIHYIRETYLKPHNAAQFVAVDATYLKKLPAGDTRGPEPSKIEPWSAMDYGPTLTHTYEIPGPKPNFAYKGIAFRLDPGAGGVARGQHWQVFDTDTLRIAAAWSATAGGGNRLEQSRFIDWQGIQFNGAHGVHPRIVGELALANTGPGWANPATGKFDDDQRVVGRDGRRYGPLPRSWARYRGLYQHGDETVLSYTVGETAVLEMPGVISRDDQKLPPVFLRTFKFGPRSKNLTLQIAEHPDENGHVAFETDGDRSFAVLQPGRDSDEGGELAFDGRTFLEVPAQHSLDWTGKDFSILARIKTRSDGTILALAKPDAQWTPDGQTLFVRGGRLGFDIGWVGAVTGKKKVNDGEWHLVAATFEHASKTLRLYVDGKLDAEGKLAAKKPLAGGVVRIGYTSPNFPSDSFFQGEIAEVRFHQRRLTEKLGEFPAETTRDDSLAGRWVLTSSPQDSTKDLAKRQPDAVVLRGQGKRSGIDRALLVGVSPLVPKLEWGREDNKLRLTIPAGDKPLRFTLWQTSAKPTRTAQEISAQAAAVRLPAADRDLQPLTLGSRPRWPEKLVTRFTPGDDSGPLAVDVLTSPDPNPWLAQTRFTGLDFLPDGRLAVCSWDGDVWIVEEANAELRWQRIASGLFQPLGLKVVNGKIHLTCRDQLVVLHDLNGDGETDFYECLNNDHQVTEHFHEFAMGLQTDAAGNFLYAKSARHGLPAVVPQHGTLLRVSPDAAKTEIIANGFRAANGVCLNPDGSFVVTDQEGHWNPKNRINWVTLDPSGKPKFYGNMFGYHDVTDPADSAMVPPLCWITNAFDRSPAELLWVDSQRWGPLDGSLLNLSYGYGKVFLTLHEKVAGLHQGGLIELPLPTFPTGIMRGRFNPRDGQLYACGMFAWAGNATQPGGLYRIRATGQPYHLPLELKATKRGLVLKFTDALDATSIDVKNNQVSTWSLQRSARYGSEHYNTQALTLRSTALSDDAKTLTLDVQDLAPTMCMEIKYALKSASGVPIVGKIHNTIHGLGE